MLPTQIDMIMDSVFLNVQGDIQNGRLRIMSQQNKNKGPEQQMQKILTSKFQLKQQIQQLIDQEQELSKIIDKKKPFKLRRQSHSVTDLYENEQNLQAKNYTKRFRADSSQRQIIRQSRIQDQEDTLKKYEENHLKQEINHLEVVRQQRQINSSSKLVLLHDLQLRRQNELLIQNNEFNRIKQQHHLKLIDSSKREDTILQRLEQERQKSLEISRDTKFQNQQVHQKQIQQSRELRVNQIKARQTADEEFEKSYILKINDLLRTKIYTENEQQHTNSEGNKTVPKSLHKIHEQYYKWTQEKHRPQVSLEKQHQLQNEIQYLITQIPRKQKDSLVKRNMIKKQLSQSKNKFKILYDSNGQPIIQQDDQDLDNQEEKSQKKIGNQYLVDMKKLRQQNPTIRIFQASSQNSEQIIKPKDYLLELRHQRESVQSEHAPSSVEGYLKYANMMEVKAQRQRDFGRVSTEGDDYLIQAVQAKLMALNMSK